ncbi:MAG TPA: hypothetical protein VMF51_19165 [Nocardioides sp.]|uniref:hypothetical protein n=1 Tax=Nocardioides sp. TaxID=35761 RepID=UPI002CF48227|nr:hypothetical protein [Nocardioides sp.]HTW17258.1 hypothetical protein [Nocardioides sp.]
MAPRTLADLCGALGGLVWVVRWILAVNGAGDAVLGTAYGAGLALLAIGVAGAGARLARAAWLSAVVAVCFPVLAWSVLMVLHELGDEARVDGVLGVVALLVWVPLVRRSRRRARLGAHAA